ncbi:hypothetical protein RESH_03178 [Rhodopirellula europaea SH398]|uniref:Uncharacterized protein n=1 Tax=Rhodopirellula europaea SH398 TaxID=1263868 RepID=M5S3N4_9BACT|nr:hypothetical protein RESH_03178 [Rhodopirellula europaea SH398]
MFQWIDPPSSSLNWVVTVLLRAEYRHAIIRAPAQSWHLDFRQNRHNFPSTVALVSSLWQHTG